MLLSERDICMEIDKMFDGIIMYKMNFNINTESKEKVEFDVEGRAKMLKPKSGDDKSVLIMIHIASKGKKEDFNFEFEAGARYNFDERPENYEKFVSENCLPDAIGRMYTIIDEIMETAGHNPLNLAGMEHS